ncbi:MAG: DUF1800 domain-containing protein [Cyclobacteriaceae bacterium]
MAINRRDFVKVASVASLPLLLNTPSKAASQLRQDLLASKPILSSPEYGILNKLAYGPTEADVAYVKKVGLEKYLDEQLNPDSSENPVIAKKISELTFKVTSRNKETREKTTVEMPITYLDKSADELWSIYLNKLKGTSGGSLIQPAREVVVSTWLKAVHSKWQLKEVMAEFWHNHFNIDTFNNRKIPLFFVQFDRDIIRKHCFGNFRVFLEDTAKSPAMLYYLNNNASKASPANENYARELFELHTLGEDNYFNQLYNKWKDVPGAEQGKAVGYIDEDVYEAARAFTGWTVGDGSRIGRKKEKLPSTGKFHYQDSWHDHYQKRITGIELPSNQGPMDDAQKVLDIVAYHKGTAEFICKKLCVRLVSDEPSKALLSKAVSIWMVNQKAPDQIAQVIRAIVLTDEFKSSYNKKVKRPLELVVSLIRSTGMDLTPNQQLHNSLKELGYQQFAWPAPTGHPDHSEYWTGTGMMLKRWKAMERLTHSYYPKATTFDSIQKSMTQYGKDINGFIEYWYARMVGVTPTEDTRERLFAIVTNSGKSNTVATDTYRAKMMVASIAMLPEFQLR